MASWRSIALAGSVACMAISLGVLRLQPCVPSSALQLSSSSESIWCAPNGNCSDASAGGTLLADPGAAPLFASFPITSNWTLSTGDRVAVPFHAYRCIANVLYGTIDAQAAQEALASQGLYPVTNAQGKGLAAFYIMQYTQAVLSPYHELVINVAASLEPNVHIDASSPFSVTALAAHPQVRFFVMRLWLGNADGTRMSAKAIPIVYGREILGFDKFPAKLSFDCPLASTGRGCSFESTEAADGVEIRGHLHAPSVIDQAYAGLAWLVGWPAKAFLQALSSPFTVMPYFGARGNVHAMPEFRTRSPEGVMAMYMNPATVRWAFFDPAKGDTFSLRGGDIEALEFSPELRMWDPNLAFAMPPPHNYGA